MKNIFKHKSKHHKCDVDYFRYNNDVAIANFQLYTPRMMLKNHVSLAGQNDIYNNVEIGRFSSLAERTQLCSGVKIGMFCGIAQDVKIGISQHPLNWLSISKFQYSSELDNIPKPYTLPANPETIIGNDVWIGTNAIIQPGITIGHGAVIGSGAVVTHDVPPYAIVAGVPAKLIRYRFSDDIIADLLQLKWWNLPYDKILSLPFNDIKQCINDLKSMIDTGDTNEKISD